MEVPKACHMRILRSVDYRFIDLNFFLYFLCLFDLPDVHFLLETRHSKLIQRNWLFLKSFYNNFLSNSPKRPTPNPDQFPGFFLGGAEFLGDVLVGWFVWKANENGHYDLVQVMERLWKSHQKHLGKTTSFQSNLGMLPWDAEAKEGRWHRVDLKPSLWGWKDGRVGIYFRICWSNYEGRREFCMNHSG